MPHITSQSEVLRQVLSISFLCCSLALIIRCQERNYCSRKLGGKQHYLQRGNMCLWGCSSSSDAMYELHTWSYLLFILTNCAFSIVNVVSELIQEKTMNILLFISSDVTRGALSNISPPLPPPPLSNSKNSSSIIPHMVALLSGRPSLRFLSRFPNRPFFFFFNTSPFFFFFQKFLVEFFFLGL